MSKTTLFLIMMTAGRMLYAVNADTYGSVSNEVIDPVGVFLSGPLPWWRNQEGFYSDDIIYRVDMKQQGSGQEFTFVRLNRDQCGNRGSVWMTFKKSRSGYEPIGYAIFTPPLGFYEGRVNQSHTNGYPLLKSIGAGHDLLTVRFISNSFLDPKNASVRKPVNELHCTQISPCTSQPIQEISWKYDTPVEKQTYLEKVTGDASIEVIAGKLEKTIIPKLILTDCTLEKAISELTQDSKLFDTTESNPEKKGVNIFAKLLPVGDPIQDAADINLSLSNVTLKNSLAYLAALRNLNVHIEPYAVVLRPIGWGECGTLTRKAFYVPQDFFSENGSVKDVTNASANKFLKSKGLFLPVGSVVNYRISLNTLSVRSTRSDLEILENLLKEYSRFQLKHDHK